MKTELQQAIDLIMKIGQANLIAQGHVNTGVLLQKMRKEVDSASAALYGEEYGLAQETGIKADRHPFRSKGGGVSGYIEAIAEWVRNKGIESDIVKSKGIAFAIGKSQSGVGLKNGITGTGMHSTNKAFDISKQGWLSSAIDQTQSEVTQIISDGAKKGIDLIIKNMIKEANRNLGKV